MDKPLVRLGSTTMARLLTDRRVDLAVTATAQMFGLSQATTTTILQIGLPAMAQLAEANPELRRRLYAASKDPMPEPIEDFYARLRRSSVVRQAVVDDYKAVFGAMFESANRSAGMHAGTTDGQAREVLASLLPAVSHVLGQANRAGNERGFVRLLNALQR